MIDLDDLEGIARQDPEGMRERIAELPDQLRECWQAVATIHLPPEYSEVDNVIVLGMGGSAIGGDLVRTLVARESRVPIEVVRDYCLPAYVGPRTLAIASSYSGNTEETLASFALARAAGAKLVATTTGGELLRRCRAFGLPVFQFSYQSQPRAALGYSVAPLLRFLHAAGIIDDKSDEVQESVRVLEEMRARLGPSSQSADNPAKKLARDLHGRLAIIYGAGLTAEVARRWKGQINENGKALAAYDVLPELNHNSVVGYDFPVGLPDQIRVVFLLPRALQPRVAERVGVTQELLRRRGIPFHALNSEGESGLAQVMSTVYLGDWTSYYLALLNGVDPTPVKAIDFLKERMARAPQ